jgi:hypothetical protein
MQAKQKTDKKQIRREIEYQGVGESGRPKDLRITNETRWVIHRVLVDVEWCNVTNSTYTGAYLMPVHAGHLAKPFPGSYCLVVMQTLTSTCGGLPHVSSSL